MTLKNLWNYLTGNNEEFSLEFRIYNSFCIVAILAMIICIPLNFALQLPVSAWLSVLAAIFQSILYYLSRFKMRSGLSLIMSIFLIHLILFLNYVYNSGIDGPTVILMISIFFMVIAVSEPRYLAGYFTMNLVVLGSMIGYEYLYPDKIHGFYVNREIRAIDIFSSYILSSMIIFMGLRYIKKNYYRAQRLLEQKAKDLEKINQTKNKMFSIISHDLRAPIASIQSYLEVLSAMDIEEADRTKIRNDLKHLTENTDMMLKNLLMWSRSQMEGIVLSRKVYNLGDTILPVIKVFKNIAYSKNVQLEYDIDPELRVFADKDMLELVVRNIISNAIKFTPSGGKITVEGQCEDTRCKITVKDNGIGMSDEIKNSIFNLRAESSYGTNNEKGVGIGLSLTKEFTEIQNGKIWFESFPQKGTTFFIYLPGPENGVENA